MSVESCFFLFGLTMGALLVGTYLVPLLERARNQRRTAEKVIDIQEEQIQRIVVSYERHLAYEEDLRRQLGSALFQQLIETAGAAKKVPIN
jgi:hypothetical protein